MTKSPQPNHLYTKERGKNENDDGLDDDNLDNH